MEEWKPYIYNYDVSNMGRVRNRVTNHILRQAIVDGGYHQCVVSCGSRSNKVVIRVHRAVATLFLDNPQNLREVNHIDGNKDHNSVDNLEWCTSSENLQHAFRLGLKVARRGEEATSAKVKNEDVQFIRDNYIPRDKVYGARALGRKFGLSHRSILRIVNGETWSTVLALSS